MSAFGERIAARIGLTDHSVQKVAIS